MLEDGRVIALDSKVTIDAMRSATPDLDALKATFPIDPVEARARALACNT